MKYSELKQKHQHEVNAFPMMFAFNQTQFEEGMKRLDVTNAEKELVSMGGRGFIRKTDRGALEELFARHKEEMELAMTDKQFLTDAIEYELGNNEFCITDDSTDTIDVLGLDLDNPLHIECFNVARRQYLACVNA